MAPHALTDPHDSSDYYPSVKFGACFQLSDAQNGLTSSITDHATLEKDVSSKKLRRLYRLDPHVWHLSPEEVEDVEEGMRYFSDLGFPLNAISPRTFPLKEGLRFKLKDGLKSIYGAQQFLVISGLNSSRHNDFENVIIHAGISSHIGNKRGMAGREGGDNTVLQHITAMPAEEHGRAAQYHGPPNQNRGIVSITYPAATAALSYRTAFPHR